MTDLFVPWRGDKVARACVIVMLSLFHIGFLARLDRVIRNRLVLAGTLYVAGSLGVEMITGVYVSDHGMDALYAMGFVTAEETLEMLGISVALVSLIEYLTVRYGTVRMALLPQTPSS